jgi:hypothetical protein
MANLSFEEATKPFVAEINRQSLDEALAKFEGRRTWKTVLAAQRMAARKERVTIPAHTLRALWRLTGGWNYPITAEWPKHRVRSGESLKPPVFLATFLGLDILEDPNDTYSRHVLLRMKGKKIGHISGSYNGPWKCSNSAKAALVALAST